MVPLLEQTMVKSYQALVDEFLLTEPNEVLVEGLMTKIGLPYSKNSIDRITLVFEKLNVLLKGRTFRKGSNDLPKYS